MLNVKNLSNADKQTFSLLSLPPIYSADLRKLLLSIHVFLLSNLTLCTHIYTYLEIHHLSYLFCK